MPPKPKPFVCRHALPEHLPALEEMIRSYLLEQATAGSPTRVTRRTVDWYRDLARSYLRGSLFGSVVVAEVEGPAGPQVVGFAMAGEDLGTPRVDTDLGKVAVVWLVWVRPEHRKLGTALSMLSYGRPRLVEQGFVTAAMGVRTGNSESHALCRAYGAQPEETVYHAPLNKEPGHG